MARAVGADIVIPLSRRTFSRGPTARSIPAWAEGPGKREILSTGLKARSITPTEFGRTLVNLLPFVECPTGIVRTAPSGSHSIFIIAGRKALSRRLVIAIENLRTLWFEHIEIQRRPQSSLVLIDTPDYERDNGIRSYSSQLHNRHTPFLHEGIIERYSSPNERGAARGCSQPSEALERRCAFPEQFVVGT